LDGRLDEPRSGREKETLPSPISVTVHYFAVHCLLKSGIPIFKILLYHAVEFILPSACVSQWTKPGIAFVMRDTVSSYTL
jgi:hypothetical protein